ncbi:uncharacterized protein ACA1_177450 [Acanthamoeba castellanii str. Neff]|uniref:Uncharacterized protein n=1 Tax=Acanthamoeba castellanii (strain ATCC 30010 / Neff) TaxID=1257118 RepID=L8GTB5_ACACF|nr:uncharacterized protein ACA1_177450 [Acanthamoeba castellanii str. Neff]ELR16137.1 hypothetical protein ACA1_177450 [Acanthamoeba castellanii str. Neff]
MSTTTPSHNRSSSPQGTSTWALIIKIKAKVSFIKFDTAQMAERRRDLWKRQAAWLADRDPPTPDPFQCAEAVLEKKQRQAEALIKWTSSYHADTALRSPQR